MSKLFDGPASAGSYKRLQAIPSAELLSDVFVQQNIWGARLQLAHKLVEQSYKDISHLNELLRTQRLRPAGWELEHQFLSLDQFYACAFRINDDPPSFGVHTAVGVPVVLCSIASEIDVYESGAELGKYFGSKLTSANSWFPWVEAGDSVSPIAIRTALDAALLTYFHEVAHVLFGHCSYKPISPEEERALEMDADFQAGTMFSLWLKNLRDKDRVSASADETVDRLVRAGFVLGTAFKVFSAPSAEYHYPSTRLSCFYAGAVFGITRTGGAPKFHSDKDGNEFWERRVSKVSNPMLAALRKTSLSYFAGTEEDIRKDLADLNSITFRVRDRLKDGPLKKLMIPVSP